MRTGRGPKYNITNLEEAEKTDDGWQNFLSFIMTDNPWHDWDAADDSWCQPTQVGVYDLLRALQAASPRKSAWLAAEGNATFAWFTSILEKHHSGFNREDAQFYQQLGNPALTAQEIYTEMSNISNECGEGVQAETITLTNLSSEARWESGRLVSANNATNTQALLWQGSPSDDRGFVRLDEVTLENGQTTTALRTHPKWVWVPNGTIKGWHPSVELPRNAVFSAKVGFVQGARNTDGVTFQVWEHHQEGGRTVWNQVAEVKKNYTGNLKPIEADLSHLAGKEVKIELRVDAGDSSG